MDLILWKEKIQKVNEEYHKVFCWSIGCKKRYFDGCCCPLVYALEFNYNYGTNECGTKIFLNHRRLDDKVYDYHDIDNDDDDFYIRQFNKNYYSSFKKNKLPQNYQYSSGELGCVAAKKHINIDIDIITNNNKYYLDSNSSTNLFSTTLYKNESIMLIVDGLVVFSKN